MGQKLASTLKEIRKKQGYASARAFFMELETKADLLFNYSYYMKIEGADLTPSEKVVQQIANLLPQADGDSIIQAFCFDLFPDRMPRLVKAAPPTSAHTTKSNKTNKSKVRSHQVELTARQIAMIGKTSDHYFAFLMTTLARQGLTLEDYKAYPFNDIKQTLEDLALIKVLYTENNEYLPAAPEFKFPKSNSSLLEDYQKLDSYDSKKAEFFGLTKFKSASFFRRISPKYMELLGMNLELIFQLIRSADETDVAYNTEAISLDLKVYSGSIKG